MDLGLGILFTVPVLTNFSPEKASTPRILAMSWTKPLVSRGVVEDERMRESLAWRQGWEETWTFDGRDMVNIEGISRGNGEREKRKKKKRRRERPDTALYLLPLIYFANDHQSYRAPPDLRSPVLGKLFPLSSLQPLKRQCHQLPRSITPLETIILQERPKKGIQTSHGQARVTAQYLYHNLHLLRRPSPNTRHTSTPSPT